MEEQVKTVGLEISQYILRDKISNLYTCSICEKPSSKVRKNVWNLFECVHFPQTFEYSCTTCERKFGTKSAWETHMYKSRLLPEPCLSKNCETTISFEKKETLKESFSTLTDGHKTVILDSEGKKVVISQFEEFDRFVSFRTERSPI